MKMQKPHTMPCNKASQPFPCDYFHKNVSIYTTRCTPESIEIYTKFYSIFHIHSHTHTKLSIDCNMKFDLILAYNKIE